MIDWNRHANSVSEEIALHQETVKKGRVPVNSARLRQLEKDLRYCLRMSEAPRRTRRR